MPFKSQAQRRLFYAKEGRGEIARSVVKEWERKTKGKKLPERLSPKKHIAHRLARMRKR